MLKYARFTRIYVMAMEMKTAVGGKLKVATAEVQRKKSEGPLYYILPVALVLAVIIFCHVAEPPAGAGKKNEAPSAQTK